MANGRSSTSTDPGRLPSCRSKSPSFRRSKRTGWCRSGVGTRWTGPEPGVGRPLGEQACGSQGVGGGDAGGTHWRQLELHPRRWAWCLRSTHVTHCIIHVLQLKDQAGGAVLQRSTLCPWNVAAGSPTWILLEFSQPHHPTTTTITSPSYLCQENLSVRKSHHDFRADGHMSPPAPVTLALCPLPGWGFLRPRCPGCWPQGPPSQLSLAWSCLGWRPRSQLCVHPGAGEEGQSQEEHDIRQNPLPDLPSSGVLGEGQNSQPPAPTSPMGEGKGGARCQEPAASDHRPNSSPTLSCPLVLDPPPLVWGARSSQGAPTSSFLPSADVYFQHELPIPPIHPAWRIPASSYPKGRI